MGDAAGIGPEIIAKAYRDDPVGMRDSFVVGDVESMRRATRLLAQADGRAWALATIEDPQSVGWVPPRCIPILQPAPGPGLVPWGQVSPTAGEFAGHCVLWAARAALQGQVAAVVTAPLHKEALHAAGLPFTEYPGHTEMLQAEVAKFQGKPLKEVPVRMMLANTELRTVLVSIHMSLQKAIRAVTYENVLETLQVTHDTLSRLLGRPPRMAVAGLNPHAGEGGLFGLEEIQIIGPAIEEAQRLGLDAKGPYAPDTIFMLARQKPGGMPKFDVVIAMYHDQGLIPVKYLGIEDGVNVTLGLPIVRTSPDHGTAFDIAGTGRADPRSILSAIRMARALI